MSSERILTRSGRQIMQDNITQNNKRSHSDGGKKTIFGSISNLSVINYHTLCAYEFI